MGKRIIQYHVTSGKTVVQSSLGKIVLKHVNEKYVTVHFHRTIENETQIYISKFLIANPHPKHSSNEGVLYIVRGRSSSIQPQNQYIIIPDTKINPSDWLHRFYERILRFSPC